MQKAMNQHVVEAKSVARAQNIHLAMQAFSVHLIRFVIVGYDSLSVFTSRYFEHDLDVFGF